MADIGKTPEEVSASLAKAAKQAEFDELLKRVQKYHEVTRKLKSGEIKGEDKAAFVAKASAERNALSKEILAWAEKDRRIYELVAILIDFYALLKLVLFELGGCEGLRSRPEALTHLSDLARGLAFHAAPNGDKLIDKLPETALYLTHLADNRQTDAP